MIDEVPPRRRPLTATKRDTIDWAVESADSPPAIVSISDIHGYLESAKSALLTLDDHPTIPPVVVPGPDGRLHWAGEDYVLVFNGDLIDRGPNNEAVLELVSRLLDEAPPGRVRVVLGNHEAIILSSDYFGFSQWFSGQLDPPRRRTFMEHILSGDVVAAYGGHNVTYIHAGSPTPVTPSVVNDSLVEATEKLLEAAETQANVPTQRAVLEDHPTVLGVGEPHLKGNGAGVLWLDFDLLPADAPPQVVGHTRHQRPTSRGMAYCQAVLQDNLSSPGGEGVFVEDRHSLTATIRTADGGVDTQVLATFDAMG